MCNSSKGAFVNDMSCERMLGERVSFRFQEVHKRCRRSPSDIIHPCYKETGYGQTGPYKDAAGYDVIIEGEAGLMHMSVASLI